MLYQKLLSLRHNVSRIHTETTLRHAFDVGYLINIIFHLHLVIECFSVKMYKGRVELDVVSSPRREGGHLPEGGDIVAGARRRDIRLLHHMV